MRHVLALITLSMLLALPGCGTAPRPAASAQPPPVTSAPTMPRLAPDPLPTPDIPCEQTPLAQIKTPGKWRVNRDRGWCYGDEQDEASGYTLRASLLKIPVDHGTWLVWKAYPYAQNPKPFTIAGTGGAYTGIILPEMMEKTGAPFWGPTPLQAVFVTERGAFDLTCAPAPDKFAQNKDEGEAAAKKLAEVCPNLLGQVRFADLGRSFAPSFDK